MYLRNCFRWFIGLLVVLAFIASVEAQTNLVYNPGFESGKPSLWHAMAGNSGATLTWATDQSHSPTHSLKIDKPNTGNEAAMWQSDNMVRYWTARIYSGVDIELGAWVKTENVNTNPVNQDAQWYLQYTFLDSSGAMIGGQPFILPIPQTSASTGGFVVDTNGVGTVILPKDAWSLVVSVVAGKNATGTVWVDDFIFQGRGGAWAGAMFNDALEADDGWFYWEPVDLVAPAVFAGSGVTSEAAHSGNYSFKLNAPLGRKTGELVWISKFIPIPANSAGKQYVLSAWVKTSHIIPDSMKNDPAYRIGFTWDWMEGVNDTATGWNEYSSPEYKIPLPAADTADDWTQYAVIITVPSNLVTSVAVRARAYADFVGTAYFDDFYLIELPTTNLVYNPGFESGKPSLWHAMAGNSGATLTWATDQSHSPTHSLKIDKPNTGNEAAMWQSDNMVRYWTARIYSGVDIELGAWVKTENVNTNPVNQDAQWYLQYTFLDSSGAMIGGQPFILPIPQTSASTGGFVVDTNGVGTVILPKDAWSLVVSVVAGKNATGTVWVDDFIFQGRGGAWAGAMFNDALEADDGWFYWEPVDLVAPAVFAGSGVTSEAAHSGNYSFKLNAPLGRKTGELVWISKFIPIPANSAGKQYVLSAWVKTSHIIPDSMKNDPAYRIGFTWDWMEGVNDTATGWNEYSSPEYKIPLPAADTADDWTQYDTIIVVPSNLVTSVAVRARAYADFVGTAYFDDFLLASLPQTITAIREGGGAGSGSTPNRYSLSQNYPNPFNPTTLISYQVPERAFVVLKVYNVLGQNVATLFEGERGPGNYIASFDGSRFASGVYFYTLQAGKTLLMKKMLLLK
jgi:hypothetical protein